jgi:Asp-tRNA(Asn)/Glu-tRNA(Gln) amidotransferase A subunit family amidase
VAGTDDAGALSVKETARLVAAGELSAVEAVTAALERAQAVDPELHAFITIAADDALREARLADRRGAARAASRCTDRGQGSRVDRRDPHDLWGDEVRRVRP